jgi:hypothetical protein
LVSQAQAASIRILHVSAGLWHAFLFDAPRPCGARQLHARSLTSGVLGGGRNVFRVLVVQVPQTNIDLSNSIWGQMPTETVANRLMAEVHFYAPWNFVGLSQDESWGNQDFYWGAPNHSTTDTAHNPTWAKRRTWTSNSP